jgi:hypothetical protein
MSPAGFQPVILAIERKQTCILEGTATGILWLILVFIYVRSVYVLEKKFWTDRKMT